MFTIEAIEILSQSGTISINTNPETNSGVLQITTSLNVYRLDINEGMVPASQVQDVLEDHFSEPIAINQPYDTLCI